MKKLLIFLITIISITSCCKDEVIGTFRLSEAQKSLNPYDGNEQLTFINQSGDLFEATTINSGSTVDTYRRGAESCELVETEELLSSLIFQSHSITSIELRIFADIFTSFSLSTNSPTESFNQGFDLVCDEGIKDLIIEDSFQDIEINQIEFQNVWVFQSCSESNQIQRILFSKENGIEFIEFLDSSNWLKLN